MAHRPRTCELLEPLTPEQAAQTPHLRPNSRLVISGRPVTVKPRHFEHQNGLACV